MSQRKRLIPLAMSIAAGLVVIGAVPSSAASTSPSVNPTYVAPGSSDALTITYTISTSPSSSWETGAGFELTGFSRSVTSYVSATPTVTGPVITCALPGGPTVTWNNLVLAQAIQTDPKRDCYAYNANGFAYFGLYGEIGTLTLSSPQVVIMTIGSGGLTASVTEGQYDFFANLFEIGLPGRDLDTATSTILISSTAPEPDPTPEPTTEPVSRPAVHQGLPMPSSGTCDDVKDADYAWGTGLTGGWQKSWQPWVRYEGASDTTGGWACIRTLQNMGGDTWVIAN